MRIAVFTLITIICVLAGGCGKKTTFYPVMPTDILSEKEVEVAIESEFDYFLEHEAVVDLGNNTYRASYYPDPLGSDDPVIVEVTIPDENLLRSDIKNLYLKSYDSRINKRKIDGVGEDAFVAFPTLTVYDRGYLICITAGAGDTKEQLDTLLTLGQKAIRNFHNYLDNA